MSSADQQPIERRSSDPPTLWLSLALGSVLIHLLFFILISVVLTRTAKVELDAEPIAVEFVDPTANPVQARSEAPIRAIAARPSQPVPAAPTSRQAPLTTQIPQASVEPTRSVPQPLIPRQPIKRRPLPLRMQQPESLRKPVLPQPDPVASPQLQPRPFRNPSAQQPDSPDPAPSQPASNPSPAQTGLPNSVPSPSGNSIPQPTFSQTPIESGSKIAQQPGGSSVSVVISSSRQSYFDPQQQPAKPIELQRTVSIYYSGAVAQLPNRRLRIEVPLTIDSSGSVVDTGKATLLSPGSAIAQAELDDIAKQLFIVQPWKFEPAQNVSPVGNATSKPPLSNLIVDAQIQFP